MNSHPTDVAGSPVSDLLCFDLYTASRAMTALYRPLLAPLELTYPQYLVLQILLGRGACGIGELGEMLQLDYGTLTPLLRRLEERGLVGRTRPELDQRLVTITLSESGRALGPELDRVRCRIEDDIDLDADQVKRLQATLKKLTADIGGRVGPQP